MYSQKQVDEMLQKARGGQWDENERRESYKKFSDALDRLNELERNRPLSPGEMLWKETAMAYRCPRGQAEPAFDAPGLWRQQQPEQQQGQRRWSLQVPG